MAVSSDKEVILKSGRSQEHEEHLTCNWKLLDPMDELPSVIVNSVKF